MAHIRLFEVVGWRASDPITQEQDFQSVSRFPITSNIPYTHKAVWFWSSKIFQARDGQNYRWRTRGGYPEVCLEIFNYLNISGLDLIITISRWLQLVVEGHSHTIATFHKPKWGIFSKSHLASLEIRPEGMNILDDIVTTFVLFEHNRRKRKRAAHAASASG
jgi:hypothetical protein